MEHFSTLLVTDRGGGPPFQERLRFALKGALERSHGALLAVTRPQSVDAAFRAFENYARLRPPIDLDAGELADDIAPGRITERGTMTIAAALHALMGMDGIVLFSSDGYVHGYRCFVPAGGAGQAAAAHADWRTNR